MIKKEWLRIGKKNIWIKQVGSCNPEDDCAYERRWDESYFHQCKDLSELKEKFIYGNWCLGQAFYMDNICFINQVNGGCEWLVIKDATSFDSWSCTDMIESDEFDDYFNRVKKASTKDLAKLNY